MLSRPLLIRSDARVGLTTPLTHLADALRLFEAGLKGHSLTITEIRSVLDVTRAVAEQFFINNIGQVSLIEYLYSFFRRSELEQVLCNISKYYN